MNTSLQSIARARQAATWEFMEGGAKRGGEQAEEKKQKTAIGEPAAEAGRLPEDLRKTTKEPQPLPWLRLLAAVVHFVEIVQWAGLKKNSLRG